jgi:hypothetical protein
MPNQAVRAAGFNEDEAGGVMSKQTVIASVFRDGVVRIDNKCREGAAELCVGPMDVVVDVVSSYCVLCHRNVGYLLPKLPILEDDGEAVNFILDVSKQMQVDIAIRCEVG